VASAVRFEATAGEDGRTGRNEWPNAIVHQPNQVMPDETR